MVPTAAICSSKGMIPLETIKRDMTTLGRQAFRKAYGKIWDLAMIEVSTEAIASLAQYYDQPLRCFTFGDFQLSPMVEEFEEILGCPLGGRKPYLFTGFYPSLARISKIVQISAQELDHRKQVENGVVGIPRKYLEVKARILADKGEWIPFIDILTLLIFGGVLFPNVDGLVDLAAIDAFLAYHNHKESLVVAMLADLYDTFDRKCEKNNTRIVCCTPALYVWLVSHLFRQEVRHACPLESHRSCTEKGRVNWDQLLARKEGASEGRTEVLISCGGFPNVPLMGTRGCISYNPVLAIRQLGYPMRGAPLEEEIVPTNVETLQKVRKAWEVLQKKKRDKEFRGSNNGPIGGYREWLKAHVQGLDWLPSLRATKRDEDEAPEEDEGVQAFRTELKQAQTVKERFKSAALKIRKENAELRDVNIATTKALEQETKRACREEHSRNKFRGALWGSNSELKLRREERDQSRYQEELSLAMTHEHRVADEYAQVYAEKETRGRVIDSLHQEATMWMDRFALTLSGSQELPRLLAKAKAMADTYSAPEEIHRLLSYCARADEGRHGGHERANDHNDGGHNKHEKDKGSRYGEPDAPIWPQPNESSNLKYGRQRFGNYGRPHDVKIQNKHAFPPYGLPPNYTPPNVAYTPSENTHEIPHHNLADFEPCLRYATGGQAVGGIPLQNTLDGPQYHPQPHPLHSTVIKNPHAMVEMGKNTPKGGETWQLKWHLNDGEKMIMIVDTLPVFNYEKMVGYTPSSFTDLVFASKKIEVGLKRGKFNHPAWTNEKIGANEEGEDEGETHAMTAIPSCGLGMTDPLDESISCFLIRVNPLVLVPSPSEDYTSSPSKGHVPSPSEDYTSSPSEDYTSSPSEDYTSSPSEDFTSSPLKDYMSAPSEDHTSSPSKGHVPSTSEDYTSSPSKGHGYTPSPSEDYTSSPLEDYTSSPSEDYMSPIFKGGHALTFRGLHILAIIGLHFLAFKRRHVLNFRGLHALAFRGLRFLGHPLILEGDQLCKHNQRGRLSRSYYAYRGKISPVPLQRDKSTFCPVTVMLISPCGSISWSVPSRHRDRAHKTPSGPGKVQQGPRVSSSGYGPLSVLQGARTPPPQQGIAPAGHPVDPKKSNRVLGFPALITGLCQFNGVPVAPTRSLGPALTGLSSRSTAPLDGRRARHHSSIGMADTPPPPLEFTSAHPQKGLSIAYTTWSTNRRPSPKPKVSDRQVIRRPAQDVKEALLGGNLDAPSCS
ncbi:RNA-binding protein 12B [Glycine soja]